MARKKKQTNTNENKEKSKKFDLIGGPRNGDTMILVNPPPKYLRLAFPEWCTYEFDKTKATYFYLGPEPAPKTNSEGWF